MTFPRTCDNCGGEGGWEIVTGPTSKWGDPTPGGEWVECQVCNGSGWVEDVEPPPAIDQDEFEQAFTELEDFIVRENGILLP